MTTPAPSITEVTSYTELIGAIDLQRQGMGLRHLDFEKLAGFAPGLWGKVAGLLQVKQIRIEKTFDALRAAGLRLRIEVDPQQLAKMQARIEKKMMHPRQANQARMGHSASLPSAAVFTRVLKPVGRLGGKARWARKSQKERSDHMRMMAMAGVRKRRKEMKRRERQRKRAHAARKERANADLSGLQQADV